MKTIEQYKQELQSQLLPWVEKNDSAHQWSHFDNVYEAGILLNESLGLCYPKEAILLVAYVHDLFSNKKDRDEHHNLSADWILTDVTPTVKELIQVSVDKWPIRYDNGYHYILGVISMACKQHRASFHGVFYNEFCELMNSADYEKPNGLFKLLERSYKYSLSNGLCERSALVAALDHMKDKYGRNGYAKHPEMYTSVFNKEIEEIYQSIDKIPKGEYSDNFLKFMKYMIYR